MPSRPSDARSFDPTVALAQSEGVRLRDAVADRINALGLLTALRVVPTFQWQPEDATACGVYLKRERKTPLGDANAGEPSFEVDAVIGVSVLTRVDDPDDLDYATSFYSDPIERALLTDPGFLGQIEGVTGLERMSLYPPNGSAYMSDTRLELTVRFTEFWEPYVPDEYLGGTLQTRPSGSGPSTPTAGATLTQTQD